MLVNAIKMQKNFHPKANVFQNFYKLLYKHETSKSWLALPQRNFINSSPQKKSKENANELNKRSIFIAYSNSLAFSLQISLITFICFLKKYKDNEEFFILGY